MKDGTSVGSGVDLVGDTVGRSLGDDVGGKVT